MAQHIQEISIKAKKTDMEPGKRVYKGEWKNGKFSGKGTL